MWPLQQALWWETPKHKTGLNNFIRFVEYELPIQVTSHKPNKYRCNLQLDFPVHGFPHQIDSSNGCEDTVVDVANESGHCSARKSNSQVLNLATQILFQWLLKLEVIHLKVLLPVNLLRKTHQFCAKLMTSGDTRRELCILLQVSYWPLVGTNPALWFIMTKNAQAIQWLHERGGRGSKAITQSFHITNCKSLKVNSVDILLLYLFLLFIVLSSH